MKTAQNRAASKDGKLAERVRAALRSAPLVEEKRMFGGIAFMVRGKMCVCARRGRILCRIDPSTHDALLARGRCSTMVMRGRPLRGYITVQAEDVAQKRALDGWVRRSLAYNETIAKGRP